MGEIQMRTWSRRDLTIISTEDEECFVIACDSCGAIGEKPEDILSLPAHLVAKLTLRVTLSEIMCAGAVPVTITNGAAAEMHPTGEQFILGIQDELKNAGFSDVTVTGSTEENFKTNMTALAITVIGACKESDLKFGKALKGDKLILLGEPRVGEAVDLQSIGFYSEIRELLRLPEVREIVPIGSKGIRYEADVLAAMSNMNIRYAETEICYESSAGPATCLIVLCSELASDQVLNIYPQGVIIGETV